LNCRQVPLELLILDGQQRPDNLDAVLALKTAVQNPHDKGREPFNAITTGSHIALEGGGRLEGRHHCGGGGTGLSEPFGRTLSSTSPHLKGMRFAALHCDQILNSDAWEEALQEHAPDHFPQYMKFRKVLNAFRGCKCR
jgi:hypothetical protein